MEHVIKLLIVDDEARFLNAIAQRLTKRGFDVRTAENGENAIELARSEKFDIALPDLRMPGMDGGEVLRASKEAYQARLERRFASDQAKMDKILALAEGESPLGILRKLKELDDSRK